MNNSRVWHTSSTLTNGKVLVTSGNSNSAGSLNSAELYDPSTETWTNTGSMHETREWHKASILPNEEVLVTGGSSGAGIPYLNSAEL
jgi:N-acetylneuraminic acid mutarotase